MHLAFTHEEAEEICEDFEDLKDTEFSYNGDMVLVDDIVIVPALPADPEENNYDVVIVASGASEGVQYNITIREYITLKGVSYNFPS